MTSIFPSSSGNSGSRRDAVLLLVAVVLAFAAQQLFTGDLFTRSQDTSPWQWSTSRSLAVGLLAVSAGLAAFAAGRTHARGEELAASGPTLSFLRLWPALLLWFASNSAYMAWGENRFVRLAWVLSVPALLVPLLRERTPARNPIRFPERIAVLALTLMAGYLRFVRLGELPAHVDNDVSVMAIATENLLRDGDPNWIGLAPTDHLMSWHQVLALGLRLFGDDLWGFVALTTVAGVLTVPLVFLLGRELFGSGAGLCAAAFLTFSYTHIHFCRILFGPKPTFLLTAAILFLVRGFRSGSAPAFAAGGAAIGGALLLYDSGRVGPVVVVSLVALMWLTERKLWTRFRGGLALMAVGALVAFGPMLSFALRDFDGFLGRGDTVALFGKDVMNHSFAKYRTNSVPAVLLQQVGRTFLTLHLYGDESPHFAFPRPMVSSLAAALAVMGAGAALARIRSLLHATPVIWIFVTFLFGGVLTSDPPYWPHLNIALPAIFLLSGLGAHVLVSGTGGSMRVVGGLLVALLTIGIVLTGVHGWRVYERFASGHQDKGVCLARYLGGLDARTFALVAVPNLNLDDDVFDFLAKGRTGRNVSREELFQAAPPAGRPLLLVSSSQDDAEELKRLHPRSVTGVHAGLYGRILFWTTYVVPEGLDPVPPPPKPSRPGLVLVLALFLGLVGWAFAPLFGRRGGRQGDTAGPPAP